MVIVTDFEPLEQKSFMDALALRYEFVSMKKDGHGGARIEFRSTPEEYSRIKNDLFRMFCRTVSTANKKQHYD